MPPKHYNNHHGRGGHGGGGGKQGSSYASVVQAPNAASPTQTGGKKAGPQGIASVDLASSSPDELQAQMNRLLSEVDRVRNALELRKGATPANNTEDEDEEVLRLRYENNAASASLDDDQPQTVKKSRGISPNTANAVAKAFGQHEGTAHSGGKRGGSPLMDEKAWVQKMFNHIPPQGVPASLVPAVGTGVTTGAARAFHSPPPLPAAGLKPATANDTSTLSTVPDTSALSDQDQMWGGANNGQPNTEGGVWQHQPHHATRGRGAAVYTNPHRTGAMSYRQNHHHDSIQDTHRGRGGRGGFNNNGLFSDENGSGMGGGNRYHNEYVTTKDYVVVEFKRDRTKKYPCATKVQPGDYVIVDGDRGQDCGLVIQVAYAKDDGTFEVQCIDAMLKNYVRTKPERARVLRVATPEEVSFLHSDIDAMEKNALQTCKAKCDELGITDLKLVDCEFQFDRQKVSFFFDSERSIDFRALVRDLHRAFGIRIWMENINPGVKNSVPADAQADVMWAGEDTQRMLGMAGSGATMMMMSAAPLMPQHQGPTNSNSGYRGRGAGPMRR